MVQKFKNVFRASEENTAYLQRAYEHLALVDEMQTPAAESSYQTHNLMAYDS